MPPDTAAQQLERILHILPAAAREHGIPIDELAAQLDVDYATVLRDIEQVTARAYYHPAGAVDKFSIMIGRRSVRVHAPAEFTRPVRLNQREALALGLGLRALAADTEPDRRAATLALARRLEAELRAPDVVTVPDPAPRASPSAEAGPTASDSAPDEPEVDYDDYALAFDDDGFRGVIADAVELRRVCTIWYLKPGAVAPVYRSIAPLHLVYAGLWYVAAYDLDREGLRFFRLDRVLDASLDAESAPQIPAYELAAFLRNGAPYTADDDIEVQVRYSPRVARWVMERAHVYPDDDGSVILRHRVADPRWIVRHVLQYGGEARVEQPAVARAWVAAAAGAIGAAATA